MKTIHIVGILAAILLCAAVAATVFFAPSGQGPNANLANPSAVWCEEQGYEYEIRTDSDGSQSGVCIFPDGTEQDAWEAYYAAHPEDPGSPDHLELSVAENGGVFSIAVNGAIRISLPENPSTGYGWNMTFPGELTLQDETYQPAAGSEGLVGAGGTRTWDFSAQKPGTYQISGVYERPWEGVPADAFSVTIEVV